MKNLLFSQQLVKRELLCERERSESEKWCAEHVCVCVWCGVCAVHDVRRAVNVDVGRNGECTETKSREAKFQECSEAAGRFAEHLVDVSLDEHVEDGGGGYRSADPNSTSKYELLTCLNRAGCRRGRQRKS